MRFNLLYTDNAQAGRQIAEEFFSRLSLLNEISIHQIKREVGNEDFLIKFKNNDAIKEVNSRYGTEFNSDTAFNFESAPDEFKDMLGIFVTLPLTCVNDKYSGLKNALPKKVSKQDIVKMFLKNAFESVIFKDVDSGTKYQFIFPVDSADRSLEKYFTTHSAKVMSKKSEIEKEVMSSKHAFDWTNTSIEAVQPFGLFVDCDKIMAKMKQLEDDSAFFGVMDTPLEYPKFKELVSPITAFEFKQDFAHELMAIKRLFPKFTYLDWAKFVAIAAGASRFKKEFLDRHFESVNLIHSKMSEYRDAESKLGSKGDKANTADIAIHNFDSASDFLTAFSKNPVVVNDGVVIIKDGDKELGKFVQVSLKGSENDPLGKVTNTIKSLFGMKSGSEATKELKEEINFSVIAESFISDIAKQFKVAVDSVKSMGAAVFNKIVSFVAGAKKWIKNFVTGLKDGYAKNYKKYGSELFSSIQEAEADDFSKEIESVLSLDSEGQTKFWNNALTKIVASLKKANKFAPMAYLELDDSVSPKSKLTKEAIIILIGNYVFSKTIAEMFNKAEEPVSLSSQLVDIVSEMIFGKTDLPLFMLYTGVTAQGKSWKYVGTKKEFANKRKDIIKQALDAGEFSLPLISLRAKANEKTAGTYVFNLYTLSNIFLDDDGDVNVMYMDYRIGTAGSQIIMAGSTEVPYTSVPMPE